MHQSIDIQLARTPLSGGPGALRSSADPGGINSSVLILLVVFALAALVVIFRARSS